MDWKYIFIRSNDYDAVNGEYDFVKLPLTRQTDRTTFNTLIADNIRITEAFGTAQTERTPNLARAADAHRTEGTEGWESQKKREIRMTEDTHKKQYV